MTNVVFRSAKNGSAVVYTGTINAGGTLYTKTLSTTEDPVATLSLIQPGVKVLTAVQDTLVTMTKQVFFTRSVTQDSVLDVYTATNLQTPVTTVNEASVASLDNRVGKVLMAGNPEVASLSMVFNSGSGVTTYVMVLTTVEDPVTTLNKGLQVHKSVTQDTGVTLGGLFGGQTTGTLLVTMKSATLLGTGKTGAIGRLTATMANAQLFGSVITGGGPPRPAAGGGSNAGGMGGMRTPPDEYDRRADQWGRRSGGKVGKLRDLEEIERRVRAKEPIEAAMKAAFSKPANPLRLSEDDDSLPSDLSKEERALIKLILHLMEAEDA